MSRSSVVTLRRTWSTLRVPEEGDVVGDLEGAFVRPLRRLAPWLLGLLGLARWWGKRVTRTAHGLRGENLVWRHGGLSTRLPMSVSVAASLSDGRPALVLRYAPGARRPWRWVRDELRVMDDGGHLVGMTYVDVWGLRRLGGVPFLLHRV
jgi:hypothetical protein